MKNWIKICLTILVVAAISIGAYFILRACGVTDVESLRELIASCGAWGWIVFITLFTLCTSLLCFIPASSMTFIIVSVVLFGATKGFIISSISVFLSSSLMFVLGNTLGEKVAVKLVGKESLEKTQNLVDVKSKMLLPLMFLFPVFPDDALCLVAGMTKMRYWYFALIVGICRTIGVATTCFLGSGLINWAVLRLVDWFVLISVCLFWILLIFQYQHKIEKFITRDKKTKQQVTSKLPANKAPQVINYTKRMDNLIQKRAEFEKSIERYNTIISEKRYKGEDQLHNIKVKIAKIQSEKRKLEKNLQKEYEAQGLKTSFENNSKKELREIACEQLNLIMKNEFPNINYSINQSVSTESIYLSLKKTNGVEKTIRFSNHKSAKMSTSYPIEKIMSKKEIKKIIAKNIRVLDRKSVYVLIDKLEEEKAHASNND